MTNEDFRLSFADVKRRLHEQHDLYIRALREGKPVTHLIELNESINHTLKDLDKLIGDISSFKKAFRKS